MMIAFCKLLWLVQISFYIKDKPLFSLILILTTSKLPYSVPYHQAKSLYNPDVELRQMLFSWTKELKQCNITNSIKTAEVPWRTDFIKVQTTLLFLDKDSVVVQKLLEHNELHCALQNFTTYCAKYTRRTLTTEQVQFSNIYSNTKSRGGGENQVSTW